MNLQRIFVPAVVVALIASAWFSYGWQGLTLVGGGLLMWALLHFTRMMHVLKQAADRPIGHVASAVMLNAKLRAGVNLMHVMALTRTLGEQLSPCEAQPEVYRWTDAGGSHVTCEFANGRLVKWQLERPDVPRQETSPAAD